MKNHSYRLIFDFMKRHALSYGAGFLFMIFASGTQSTIPKILGDIIDTLKQSGFDRGTVLSKVALLVLATLTAFALTFLWRTLVIGNARKLECSLRGTLFRHFQALSPSFYSRRKTGDLIAYAVNDLSTIRMAFGPATAMCVNGLAICASSLFFMATTIDLRLTLLTLAPIPLVILCIILIGKKIRIRFQAVQRCFGDISDRVQENISGVRVIKAYVQEEQEIERFGELNERMARANLAIVRSSSALSPAIEILFSISFFLNLVIGGNLVLCGSISLGDFVAFNTYLAMIMAPIVSIGRVITNFQKGFVSVQRINELLDITSDIGDRAHAQDSPILGHIQCVDLSFRYPGAQRPALEHIDLCIKQGKTIGIIGKTASGKTTLAHLLVRLYEVESEALIIDGVDIQQHSLASLRAGIALVPQDVFLFSASIRDNITFFRDSYTDIELTEAARFAGLLDTIEALDEGFDTMLGERGVNLSGGQQQRLSIARAAIRKPPVLILDDALSAVDAATESSILGNIARDRRGKTTIIITHRASAIAQADEILVLSRGTIAERGTHEELLGQKGLYHGIASEQEREAAHAYA